MSTRRKLLVPAGCLAASYLMSLPVTSAGTFQDVWFGCMSIGLALCGATLCVFHAID